MYSIFNNVLGNVALRIYLCKKKKEKYATCVKNEYMVLKDCWTVGKQISAA